MNAALLLARRGYGALLLPPAVRWLLIKDGATIGRGLHRGAGAPRAESEAIREAEKRGRSTKGATLYVTLEPCCTYGRTPPCTEAIIAAGIKRVVVGATDPNPQHCGKAFAILKRAGIEISQGVLAEKCERLNEAFNHWIVHHTPFVTVKAAMTLDGKIATAAGESKWITSEKARAYGMKLRQGADAVLVGINTILADDPSLTVRSERSGARGREKRMPRRIVLDAMGRTPLDARVVGDGHSRLTTIMVSKEIPKKRLAGLAKRVNVMVAPSRVGRIDLFWLLKTLGSQNVTSLLVEGGGEVNASFLLQGLAQRIAFFYSPKILGGRDSRPGVGGVGVARLEDAIRLKDLEWKSVGEDLLLSARIA